MPSRKAAVVVPAVGVAAVGVPAAGVPAVGDSAVGGPAVGVPPVGAAVVSPAVSAGVLPVSLPPQMGEKDFDKSVRLLYNFCYFWNKRTLQLN